MDTLTLDLETTTEKYLKRKASPFCPTNYVVAAGYKHNPDPKELGTFCNYFTGREGFKHHLIPIRESTNVLIGFNIKFDLLFMWGKSEVREYFARGGRVWDCQYVHYLLQGMSQPSHMASMDSVIESYGGLLKIDEVKSLWEAGVDTPDIDETLLMDYLVRDVDNTELIFKKQYELAKNIHPKFLHMIETRMNGLLATIEMEYNGLTVDVVQGELDRKILQEELEGIQASLNDRLPKIPAALEFNWRSIYHRSVLLFGGTLAYMKWEQHEDEFGTPLYTKKTIKEPIMVTSPVGEQVQARYKSGKKKGELKFKNVVVDDETKPKGKQQKQYFDFHRLTEPKTIWASTSLVDARGVPIYSTNSEIVEYLGNTTNLPFLKDLAIAQTLSKDIGTYYWSENDKGIKKGMLTLVGTDGRIHHKLNHTSTVTGRLSSSDPNMQNIPRGDKSLAKRMFVSRFGVHGKIIEIDYSQLEVIVQGVLSRDRQLCEDIREGVDFHVKRLSATTGRDYADLKHLHNSGDHDVSAQRTQIKGFTFQRAYGAGPQAIADSTGMSLDSIKSLIKAEEELYPGILSFDSGVQQSINSSAELEEYDTFLPNAGIKRTLQRGHWFSPTGTKYVWREQEAPQWMRSQGKLTSFSPTERKNWPIQGFGGEIVQAMIGELFRWFSKNKNVDNKAFLINTVHDCVLIDAHEDVVQAIVPIAKQILEAVPVIYNNKETFNMSIDVPFTTSVEIGPNWYDMEHYDA